MTMLFNGRFNVIVVIVRWLTLQCHVLTGTINIDSGKYSYYYNVKYEMTKSMQCFLTLICLNLKNRTVSIDTAMSMEPSCIVQRGESCPEHVNTRGFYTHSVSVTSSLIILALQCHVQYSVSAVVHLQTESELGSHVSIQYYLNSERQPCA